MAHLCKLDNIFSNTSLDPKSIVIILDASIKNNIATFISLIHFSFDNIRKTVYHAINVISTEVELFVIICSINQAIQIPEVTYIIVITDTIHAAEHIFDSIIHSY